MIFFSVFFLIILQSLAVSNMESNIKEIEVLQTDNIETDFSEKQLIEVVKKDESINKYIFNKEFKKVIFIPNKLINFIIN